MGSIPVVWQRFVNEKYRDTWEDEWPFFGMLQDDANAHPKADQVILSAPELIEFLTLFFSIEVVDRVKLVLEAANNSTLGESYVRRGVYGSFVQNLVYTIIGELENSGNEGDGNPNPWVEVVGRKKIKERGSGRGRRGGRGKGRGGGQGRPDGEQQYSQNMFCVVPNVLVVLRPWISPKKILNATFGKQQQRNLTIRQRADEFLTPSVVLEYLNLFYDPLSNVDESVYLFHGTRTSALQNFRDVGINPRLRRNEFSQDRAFYVTNSLGAAFEHPLLFHTSLTAESAGPVSILVFKVPTGILHGIRAVEGSDQSFLVDWYEEPSPIWQDFVKRNWNENGEKSERSSDVVIGPISIPPPHPLGQEFTALKVKGVFPQQIAFPTVRGRTWLEQHLYVILQENRPQDEK